MDKSCHFVIVFNQPSVHLVYPRNGAGRLRIDTNRSRSGSSQIVLVIIPWFENSSRVHGRSLRRFFEPGSKDRALLDRRESIEKGTRDERTTRKQKIRSGDRNRFIEPETQGTRTHTPARSNRQIASSETSHSGQPFVA